jgi:SWI/SNF related-matrix-associated actin-dependent regulator of chromatin subfamily C
MRAKNFRRIDWGNPANRKDLTDLVLRIRQELLRSGHLLRPRIFVRPDCPNASLLRHTVTKLGAELAHAEDAPGVTHVICPYGQKGDPDDGQEYLRTLEVAGGAAKVHWWYLPDSYDEWLPAAAAPADVEPELKPPGGRPWKVYVRFITDSEKYNEWMNEADYETEEAAAENKRAREAGEADGEEAREKKRAKKNPHAAEVAPGMLEHVGPGAATRRLLNPHALGLNPSRVESISHGQRQEWAGAPTGPSPTNPTPQAAANAATSGQGTLHHMIPAKASWFSNTRVHKIEQDEFPEFFQNAPENAPSDTTNRSGINGRNTSQYLALRNHIITKFRDNPGRDLLFLDAILNLDTDANDARKMYDFLCRWGIINWREHGGKVLCGGGGATATDGIVDGEPGYTGSEALLKFNSIPTATDAAEALVSGKNGVSVRSGTFKSPAPQRPSISTGIRYFCNVHPYEDCTELRYHCTKLPDIDICPTAFIEGRFPPGCSSKDFIRVAATDAVPDQSGWTDQETMLLLEGLELYGDNWGKVSEHVGGRSELQCIQRLLQLPLEDALLPQAGTSGIQLSRVLQTTEDGGAGGGEGAEEDGAVAIDGPIPFNDAGNPVMAQVAFLSSMVGPRVAAAAAQRALEVLAEEDNAGLDGAALPQKRVKAASAAGLAAASVKARLMADAEEREMQRLIIVACESQLQRVQAKLAHLEKIDDLVKSEFKADAEKAMKFEAELQAMKDADKAAVQPPGAVTAPPQAAPAPAPAPAPAAATDPNSQA